MEVCIAAIFSKAAVREQAMLVRRSNARTTISGSVGNAARAWQNTQYTSLYCQSLPTMTITKMTTLAIK